MRVYQCRRVKIRAARSYFKEELLIASKRERLLPLKSWMTSRARANIFVAFADMNVRMWRRRVSCTPPVSSSLFCIYCSTRRRKTPSKQELPLNCRVCSHTESVSVALRMFTRQTEQKGSVQLREVTFLIYIVFNFIFFLQLMQQNQTLSQRLCLKAR